MTRRKLALGMAFVTAAFLSFSCEGPTKIWYPYCEEDSLEGPPVECDTLLVGHHKKKCVVRCSDGTEHEIDREYCPCEREDD